MIRETGARSAFAQRGDVVATPTATHEMRGHGVLVRVREGAINQRSQSLVTGTTGPSQRVREELIQQIVVAIGVHLGS